VPEVLLAGVSMRAAARSAVRAGYRTFTIDAFTDLDLPMAKLALDLTGTGGRFDARRAWWEARGYRVDAVVYGSGFEDDPRAVDLITRGRVLWGNPPDVLRRIRNPTTLFDGLARLGFAVPRLAPRDGIAVAAMSPGTRWLEKPYKSGGGRGVRHWTPGTPFAGGCYFEEFIDGCPGSIVFVASHGRAVPLAVSRQIVGDQAFGADGFRYCGSILSHPAELFDDGEAIAAQAQTLAAAVARQWRLLGVNGLDFIARGGTAYPVEVNPRWSASMELVERASGTSMFALHAGACAKGILAAEPMPMASRAAIGKAIVFSRADVVAIGPRHWLGRRDVADVPRRGSAIRAGAPICTVFAEADDVPACYARLKRRAGDIYAEVSRWPALPVNPILVSSDDSIRH
jgi:predicted ATP-grasp superfamily ATP-dependent carboligase